MTMETTPAPAPTQSPERAAHIRSQLQATAGWLMGAALADLAGSTDSGSSPRDRLLSTALRPLLPKIRDTALERLGAADPAHLEQLLGAVATTLESILYHAPGDPLPRCVIAADDAGRPALVPDPRG
jgi:hypothetical protein